MFAKEEPELTIAQKVRHFLAVHWRGTVCVLAPVILVALLTPMPPQPDKWCLYTIVLMAVYWVTECIPLEMTSFLPVLIFPIGGVMSTAEVCKSYINDIVIMLLGVLFLAFALEQSGVLRRIAYLAVSFSSNSHAITLFMLCLVTHIISMWIPNTAATALMVPVVSNILQQYDGKGFYRMYDSEQGKKVASDITTCYYCAISYAATFGGIATLIGTATNLAFKGLFHTMFPEATDELTFIKFFAVGFPLSVISELFSFMYLIIVFLGALRGGDNAKKAEITKKVADAAKRGIAEERKKLGPFSFSEGISVLLFAIAIIGLCSRNLSWIKGWAELIYTSFEITDKLYIRDVVPVVVGCFLMFLLLGTLGILTNFSAKAKEELPKTPQRSVLDWPTLNAAMPFSFMFLLGKVFLCCFLWFFNESAGFALVDAMKTSGLVSQIDEKLQGLKDLPSVAVIFLIVLIVVLFTNVASNVVVANLMCPIAMRLAKVMGVNPLWYCTAAGFASSFSFLLPLGSPGNLIVYRAASISLKKMMIAGAGPTVISILFTFIVTSFETPELLSDMKSAPTWVA